MKRFAILFFALAFSSGCDLIAEGAVSHDASASKQSPQDIVSLKNGDQLHGSLLSIHPKTGIQWRLPNNEDALTFGLEDLRGIEFGLVDATRHPHGRAMVKLTNGDTMFGELESLDKGKLILNTWYAGRVTIKRAMIERIRRETKRAKEEAAVFAGPAGMEGWVASGAGGESEGWSYRNGAFYSGITGSVLARDVNIPDRALIEFDLEWQIGASFAFAFYADTTEAYKGSFYGLSLTLPGGYSLLRSAGGIQPMQPVSEVSGGGGGLPFQEMKKAHFELRVDKNAKTIALVVDGTTMSRWVENGDFVGAGTVIRFAAHGQSRVRIGGIKVLKWDGKEPATSEIVRGATDQVAIEDKSDKASGVIESIDKNQVTFAAPFGRLKIPLEHIAELCFSTKASRITPASPKDVHASLVDGSEVTFELTTAKGGRIETQSGNFGKLSIAREALRQLLFVKEQSTLQAWDESGGDSVGGIREGVDLLKLKNSDRVHGKLLGLDAKNGVKWHLNDGKSDQSFPYDVVSALILGHKSDAGDASSEDVRVSLMNGDYLLGKDVSLLNKQLTLDTAYAGKLDISRDRIREITPNLNESAGVYSGPTGLEGWHQDPANQGQWTYINGAFYSNGMGSIGRDMALPDVARIEFDWLWRTTNPQLQLALYADQLSFQKGNAYLLYLNSFGISLQRQSLFPNAGGEGRVIAGGESIRLVDLAGANKVHIGILVNKPEKTIALVVNGKLIKEWKDRSDFAGAGTGLVFGSLNQASNRISNIHVGRWDGSYEGGEAPAISTTEDTVEFANGDKLAGRITGITNNEAELSSHGLPLKVPLQRIRLMRFAADKTGEQPEPAGNVHIDLGSRGTVSLTLGNLDALNLTGSSAAFGRITLPASAIQRMDFDKRDKKASEDVGNEDAPDEKGK